MVTQSKMEKQLDDTSSKLANDYQRLCLHAGFGCNKYLKYEKGHVSPGGIIGYPIVSTADSWRLTRIQKQNTPIINKNYIAKKQTGMTDKYEKFKGKVYCCKITGEGIIFVRRNGKSYWCGQSRSGQKGTIGMVYSQEDMPFTKDGVYPDIIMNPNALPKRMTIGHLVECAFSKMSALMGVEFDATPYRRTDVRSAGEVLKELGFKSSGMEVLYNGKTGEQIKSEIFIGPTFIIDLSIWSKIKFILVLTVQCS